MKQTLLLLIAGIGSILFLSIDASAQKKPRYGRVCGDPTVICKTQEAFQPNGMPFDHGKNYVIAQSEKFYVVILSSVKVTDDRTCNELFPESDRLRIQGLFPKNKVFAVRCWEPGYNYYTNISYEMAFMGVFAGRTRAEADAFLKKVAATGKFPGANLRLTRTGFNGT